jgi:hypothetical protein
MLEGKVEVVGRHLIWKAIGMIWIMKFPDCREAPEEQQKPANTCSEAYAPT